MKNIRPRQKALIKFPGLLNLSKAARNKQVLQHLNLTNKDIQYTVFGRPYLDQPGDFSLSHKGEDILAVLNDDPRFSIGCDLESFPASPGFPFDVFYSRLPQQERLFADSSIPAISREKKLLSLFVCKECLYKAGAQLNSQSGHLVFCKQKERLLIFEYRIQGATRAHIYIEDEQDYLVGFCFFDRKM